MRMLPTRYAFPKPAQVKKQVGQIAHVSAPLKGLSLSSKLTPGDPLTAPILTNFVIEDDRINCRAGHVRQATVAGGLPIVALVPFYGQPQRLAAASDNQLFNAADGALLKAGFTSNDWDWTSFSDLGVADYTVMVNGVDGVWSWDGGFAPDGPAVAVVSISAANPAVVTVAPADIGNFTSGDTVKIAGAAGAFAVCNGNHVIASVGVPANTFTLVGVDTSAAGASGAGITAQPLGSFVKENVTAPASDTWVTPDQFALVLSHMNRLWFADGTNLAVYYLPLQQKSGEVQVLPLNALFKRGGTIKALATWTIEGGINLNDQLCIFSSNGEVVIYQGTDPDALAGDFNLHGIFRFDTPMSKHATLNYGGDLYVLTPTGVVPLSMMVREDEQLGKEDRNVISAFMTQSLKYRDRLGWQIILNPSTGRLIANMPNGAANEYSQLVRHMPRPVWSRWEAIPSRCWAWIDPYLYFGDDSGHVYRMHPNYLNDDGQPIRVDVQLAWSQYKTPAIKHFKMIQPYLTTDGDPKPYIDVKVDYDYSEPTNQPDVTFGAAGAVWDVAPWDTSDWAIGDARTVKLWTGVGAIGRVAGPRLVALIRDCSFGINGFDVIYETGAAIG